MGPQVLRTSIVRMRLVVVSSPTFRRLAGHSSPNLSLIRAANWTHGTKMWLLWRRNLLALVREVWWQGRPVRVMVVGVGALAVEEVIVPLGWEMAGVVVVAVVV